MIGHTLRLRHPEEIHSKIIDGMIEEKRPQGQSRNTFIGQIKKDAGAIKHSNKWRVTVKNVEEKLQTNLRVEKILIVLMDRRYHNTYYVVN